MELGGGCCVCFDARSSLLGALEWWAERSSDKVEPLLSDHSGLFLILRLMADSCLFPLCTQPLLLILGWVAAVSRHGLFVVLSQCSCPCGVSLLTVSSQDDTWKSSDPALAQGTNRNPTCMKSYLGSYLYELILWYPGGHLNSKILAQG